MLHLVGLSTHYTRLFGLVNLLVAQFGYLYLMVGMCLFCWSCTIYESNSSFVKSEYSYLQYHWCSTAFNVKTGLCTSSIKYSSRREGIAINTKMIAGAMVQMVSIIRLR